MRRIVGFKIRDGKGKFVGQFDESMQKIWFGTHEVDDLDIFKVELDKFK